MSLLKQGGENPLLCYVVPSLVPLGLSLGFGFFFNVSSFSEEDWRLSCPKSSGFQGMGPSCTACLLVNSVSKFCGALELNKELFVTSEVESSALLLRLWVYLGEYSLIIQVAAGTGYSGWLCFASGLSGALSYLGPSGFYCFIFKYGAFLQPLSWWFPGKVQLPSLSFWQLQRISVYSRKSWIWW